MAKTGRPRKGEHEKRTETVALRLTTAEKAHLESQAAQTGTSVSAHARSLVLGRRQTASSRMIDAALLTDLNKLCLSFNQIARARPSGCDPDALEGVLDELRPLLRQIGEAYGS